MTARQSANASASYLHHCIAGLHTCHVKVELVHCLFAMCNVVVTVCDHGSGGSAKLADSCKHMPIMHSFVPAQLIVPAKLTLHVNAAVYSGMLPP